MNKIKKDWRRNDGFNFYDEAYGWGIYCNNCGEENRIWVKKGVPVPKAIKCENCGCNTK